MVQINVHMLSQSFDAAENYFMLVFYTNSTMKTKKPSNFFTELMVILFQGFLIHWLLKWTIWIVSIQFCTLSMSFSHIYVMLWFPLIIIPTRLCALWLTLLEHINGPSFRVDYHYYPRNKVYIWHWKKLITFTNCDLLLLT